MTWMRLIKSWRELALLEILNFWDGIKLIHLTKIFVSGKCDGVNGVNQYAKNSPEWLNVMTNGAFSRRDYDEARKIAEVKKSVNGKIEVRKY